MTPEIKLGKLAEIRTGYVFRTGLDIVPNGDVGVIGMRDLEADIGVKWESIPRIITEQNFDDHMLRDGDILFTVRGVRFYGVCVDKVCGRAVASHHLFRIRVRDKDVVRPEFLSWLLNRAPAQRYFVEHAMGTAALRGLRRSIMENMPVLIPKIEKQDAIMRAVNCMRKEMELFEASIKNRGDIQDALAASLI